MAAKNYTEILALVNAGNQMGLSNTIKRDYGIPLDFTSVQPSFDDAVIYAAENTKAYVGQPLSVGGKLYIINDVAAAEKHTVGDKEYDNYLVEVGSATEGDGVTIDLEEGVLTLHGFDSALTGYLPRKAEDGSLEWVPISAVVQGDGNKVTTLTSTDGSIEITKTTDTDESLVYDLKVTHPDAPEYAIAADERAEGATSTTYHLTKDGENVDVEIVVPDAYDDTALAKRVSDIEADYLTSADKYNDEDLQERVKALEDEERYDDTALSNRVGALETTVGDAESGLVKALADEITRAQDAEKALDDAIKAIDFVDSTELENAVNAGVGTANAYTDEQIEAIEGVIAGLNHFTTKIVSSTDEVTEEGVLYLIKDESVAGIDKYNEYIVVDGAAVLIGDTTTDLSNYYNKSEIDSTVETLEGAIADEATARGELAEEVAALKAVDNATQEELDAYKEVVTADIATAKSEAIADADGKLANKVNTSDFETFKGENTTAIATAKQEAIDAAAQAVTEAGYAVAEEVAQTYATKSDLQDHANTMTTTLNDYAKKADVETDLAKKIETGSIAHSSETLAEGVTVEGTTLNIVVDAYTKQEVRDYVADVIEDMTGGESAADVLLALNNHIATYEEKVGQIDTKNGEQDTAIAAAQAQADKGVADAKTANDAITALTDGAVATNTSDINAIKGRLTTLETAKGDHETRLSSAEGKITALEAEDVKINQAIGTLQGNITTLTNEDSRLAGLITALQTNKADASAVYTKEETNTAIEDAIKAIPEVDLSEYAKSADVSNTYATITALEAIYKAGEGEVAATGLLAEEIARATAAEKKIADDLALLIENPTEALDSVKELIEHVNEHGTDIASVISRLDGHDTAIAKNAEDIGKINTAIAGIVQPKASTEVTVAEDGTLGLGEVSTDKLVMGTDTLVIDGGSAV